MKEKVSKNKAAQDEPSSDKKAQRCQSFKVIARIHTDFPTKFGVPRQSGLAPSLKGRIVFEKEFRISEAVRGLEGFTHIWAIWGFSEVPCGNETDWSPTVRPPRLGGNARMGVFATRSPFRPNPIGLSCLRLESVTFEPELGPVLNVLGADMVDGTPIYDIKPYIPYSDSHPEAADGFTGSNEKKVLKVTFTEEFPEDNLKGFFTSEKIESLVEVLSQDPRPAYQNDPDRIYGFVFAGCDIKFKVDGDNLVVCGITGKDK